MARMRTIKPEACTSESLAELDRAIRWTFAALWTHCDDEGRALWNPRLIKAAIYPLDDDVTLDVLRHEIAELERISAVCVYEIDGREYLHVPAWSQHQHPNRKFESKLPPCPKEGHAHTAHTQRSDTVVTDPPPVTPVVVVGEGDVGGEGEGAGRGIARRGTRLPDDWTPSESAKSWTLERIDTQTAAVELEKFRNHWHAKAGGGAVKVDWDATWRNWVLNAQSFNAGRGRASPSRGSTADQRVQDGLTLASELRREEAATRKELPA